MDKILSDLAFDEVVQALPSIHLKANLTIHNVLLMQRVRDLEEEVRQLGGTPTSKNGRPLMTSTKSTMVNAATTASTTKDPKLVELEKEIMRLKTQLAEKPREITIEKIVEKPVEVVVTASPANDVALKELQQKTAELQKNLTALEKEKDARDKMHQENLKTVRSQCAQILNMRKKLEQAGIPVPPATAAVLTEIETIEKIVEVEKIVTVEKIVEVPVEKIVTVEVPVEVPVERVVTIERIVHVEVPVEKLSSSPSETAVRDSERNRIVAWLEKVNIGETVRALYGQKMAKLIKNDEYRK